MFNIFKSSSRSFVKLTLKKHVNVTTDGFESTYLVDSLLLLLIDLFNNFNPDKVNLINSIKSKTT